MRKLSRNGLKFIATTAMITGHLIMAFLVKGTTAYSVVWSIFAPFAFPLFGLLFTEGMFQTGRPGKHLLLLLCTAVVSESFFDYMNEGTLFYRDWQCIMWLYLLNAGFIWILRTDRLSKRPKTALAVIYGIAALAVSWVCDIDGGPVCCAGLMMAALFYMRLRQPIIGTAITSAAWALWNSNWFCLLGIIPSLFYDPDKPCPRGNAFMRYFSYIIYPAHMAVISLILFLIH